MKNSIKFLFAAMIIAAFGVNSFAQTNESTTMSSSASVLTALSITKNVDVDYKNISATTADVVRLNPTGSGHAYVGNGATTGKLTISGSNSTAVLISYPAGVDLDDGGTTPNTLAYSMHVHGADTDAQGTSTALSAEGIAGVNVNRTLHVTTGNYYLYVGGALGGTVGTPAALNSQAVGTYTGEVTFEVTYN